MKRMSAWLLDKPWNAVAACMLLSVFAVSGAPVVLIGIVISSVVALLTLHRGSQSGFMLVASLVVVACLSLLSTGYSGVIIAAGAICSLLGSLVYQRYQSWTLVVECLGLLVVLAVVAVHLLVPDVSKFWFDTIMASKVPSQLKSMMATVSASDIQTLVKQVSAVATGNLGLMFAIALVVSFILTSSLSKRSDEPGVITDRFTLIRAGFVPLLLVIAIWLGAYLTMPLAVDLRYLALFPFLVGGISLLHYFAEGTSISSLILVLVYFGFFVHDVTLKTACVLGLFDTVFDLRKRFTDLKKSVHK